MKSASLSSTLLSTLLSTLTVLSISAVLSACAMEQAGGGSSSGGGTGSGAANSSGSGATSGQGGGIGSGNGGTSDTGSGRGGDPGVGTGGSLASGGSTASGNGGSTASGDGGSTASGSGGTSSAGGSGFGAGGTPTGGTTGAGGAKPTGGAGGHTSSGGTTGAGGVVGTGGGRGGNGGTTGAGGSTAKGGTTGSGGSTGAGGTIGGGHCAWTAGPSSTNGELTCYWFGQGTTKGQGCSSYKTYCGYCGTESGGGGGLCPTGITDTVPNIATPYFAAFPNGTFGAGKYCGMCVDVTYGGKTITATIVDECATCPTSEHIDLSLSAAAVLGLGQGNQTADPKSGVTWKAVDCPVTSNIIAEFNNGYAGQMYFQNVAFPVASAQAGGHTASQSFGYWDFGASVSGQSVTLKDTVGHTVTGTIPSTSGGSIGVQFPLTCQ